jgi:hypothetical protein
VLSDAREFYEVCGIALQSWLRNLEYREVMRAKAAAGLNVKILVMHEQNPALGDFINETDRKVGRELLIEKIEHTYQFFVDLAGRYPNVNVRKIRKGCPHQKIIRTDTRVVVIPFFYSRTNQDCPLLDGTPASPIYTAMRQEFESLWRFNDIEATIL